MKSECTRCILVPLGLREVREELALYSTWYNGLRPHQALAGRTPWEVYDGQALQSRSSAARPLPIELRVSYLAGRKHLPIIELTPAARSIRR